MNTVIIYLYDQFGYLIRAQEVDPRDPLPGPCTLTPPPETVGEQVAVYRDWLDVWEILDKKPAPPPPYVPPIEGYQVDQEKDRRTAMGFMFEGKAYLTETQSQMNDILGALADATAAITVDQAQPGDLRWADPRYDFAWSAADGSGVPMDAQTCLAFTRAAVRRKSLLVGAGLALKAMNPIPVDYMDDKYWPPMDSTAKAARK